MGILLGELYGGDLKKAVLYAGVDVVVPVPLHWKKQKKRGFNQSEMFSRGLAKAMNAVLDIQTLVRKVNTDTQTNKSKVERWENVRDVFELKNPGHQEGKNILPVDDVITRGSTMEASANTLRSVTGVKVSVATIAFATM